jgi:undecaprenyl-diphosphatase
MEHLNQSLFLLINASVLPNPALVLLARILADYAILLVPLSLLALWFLGDEAQRKQLLQAAGAALLGLLINQLIGGLWFHPRPFMLGLGQRLIAHAADSSFPSDHLTLLWSVALSYLLHPRLRRIGWALACLGLPLAWSRIYLGVHFPLDMLGALLVSALCARLCRSAAARVFDPIYPLVYLLYRSLCAPLIRRGLLRL